MNNENTSDKNQAQALNKTDVSDSDDLNLWLENYESKLKNMGYTKYIQNYKREDFAYWKTFLSDDEKAYMVGLLFYDHRKYQEKFNLSLKIGIQFECMILCDDRIDMSVSKDIDLSEFELMAQNFYDALKHYR